MARKRMIDPEFWSDEEIGHWSRSARLFYIGLWNFADDCGRFKANSGLLKGQIFPYDDPKSLKIENLKKEVSAKIVWYKVNNLQYGFLRNFLKHQRIDKPQPSKLPPPPEAQFAECSANLPRTLLPNIREVNIREEKIEEEIISDLNLVLGTSYKPLLKTKELIKVRLKEGFTLENFKQVHRKMFASWGNDGKMRPFLRPITLYSNKFESYLNQPDKNNKLEGAAGRLL